MFELRVLQRKPSDFTGNIIEEEMVFFFNEEDAEEMFDMISIMIKAARYETEYSIRVIEEGQVIENEE